MKLAGKKYKSSGSTSAGIGHWFKKRFFFSGGFSVVVEGTSKKDGEKYAVKIIEKSLIQDDIKLLRREIEIMKKVAHASILKLHEIYEDEDKVYIVMELYVFLAYLFVWEGSFGLTVFFWM